MRLSDASAPPSDLRSQLIGLRGGSRDAGRHLAGNRSQLDAGRDGRGEIRLFDDRAVTGVTPAGRRAAAEAGWLMMRMLRLNDVVGPPRTIG